MNIDDALVRIATQNGFMKLDIGVRIDGDEVRFETTAHGDGLGQHGCCFGYGDTLLAAVGNLLEVAAEWRVVNIPQIQIEVL